MDDFEAMEWSRTANTAIGLFLLIIVIEGWNAPSICPQCPLHVYSALPLCAAVLALEED